MRQPWMNAAALAGLALSPAPLLAQTESAEARPEDARVSVLITQSRAQWRVPPEQDRCADEAEEGQIVVCAPSTLRDQRMPGSSSDPGSRAALRDGMPRAPQLDRGSCKGQAGCIVGGWAPPPVYMIDLKAIPEAPEGSDADKVAKGEMSDR